jgi:uncharacterized protein (DUF1684 family)
MQHPLARAFGVLIVLLTASGCRIQPQSDQDYVARIAAARLEKDDALLKQPDPVPANRKAELLPLVYYDVNPEYNVPALFRPSKDTQTLQMVYSDGAIRDVRRLGALEFSIDGQQHKLTAFMEVGSPDVNRLFVPFKDTTSDSETYPSGRYLDLDRTPTGLYELDFNLAYNPNCYFSPLYSCPVTPRENQLPIPILAGEKIKPGHDVKNDR